MKKYRIKGVNDDHDTCDLCGKTGLKKVVWMVELDSEGDEIGTAAPYGTCCAAKLLAYTNQPLIAKTKNAQILELQRRRSAELRALVWEKQQSIANEHGLVNINGDFFFPEDASRAADPTIFGLARIEMYRKVKEVSPIFGLCSNPELAEKMGLI